jgi:hypothetical protein
VVTCCSCACPSALTPCVSVRPAASPALSIDLVCLTHIMRVSLAACVDRPALAKGAEDGRSAMVFDQSCRSRRALLEAR